LRWHLRAFWQRRRWQSTSALIADWLENTRPASSHLLLIGGSAGWMMSSAWLQRFGWLDRLGARWWPVLGAAYMLVAVKKVRGARLLGIGIEASGAAEIARRARGTPRVAGRLLRRVRDFAHVAGSATITRAIADDALTRLEVDALGLDAQDRRYLLMIADIYKGGPVGIDTVAAALSEPRDALEDIVEPYLLQQGFLQRTPRGRMACGKAYLHLGLTPPAAPPGQAQGALFDEG
jgi:Holliday junction DNA helicase RuvB